MNDDEKKKLYEAIGYSETGPPPEYPPEFVDIRFQFLLKQLVLVITDENSSGATVIQVNLNQVASVVQKRSGADALR